MRNASYVPNQTKGLAFNSSRQVFTVVSKAKASALPIDGLTNATFQLYIREPTRLRLGLPYAAPETASYIAIYCSQVIIKPYSASLPIVINA